MDFLNRVQLSLKMTFRPPDDATPLQIRLCGLGAWFLGFTIMVFLTLTIPFLERIAIDSNLGIVYLCVIIVAFGLMVTGCYRTLTGKKASREVDEYEVSSVRVIIGVVSFLLSITIPASIIVLFLYFLQWVGIEPNQFFRVG